MTARDLETAESESKTADLRHMDPDRYGCLSHPKRLWAIGAIHGEARRLGELHKQLIPRLYRRDKLIYLGNYLGEGPGTIETLDEMLKTRRAIMSMPSVYMPQDFVYLRGAREEMFSKLLQLQFAPNPAEIMDWLLDHGMGGVIEAYGTKPHVARAISREGTLSITRWTNGLRRQIHTHPGHGDLLKHLRRAAFTETGSLLFVHASVDPSRPIDMQRDQFWWDNGRFEDITTPYSGFKKVIRGYDHRNKGLVLDHPYIATIDSGCGRGGGLTAVCFSDDGEIQDQITVD
ncbi:hypothetical protein [Luteithermobacter gelatinilyticus]|uniref:hypothetical protein n=1 Tax=Luteithermobacter gelatinilyticus TaxID=2582913 RepID=UPI001AEFE1ED|nr:hypothetical protein [Luteithermobacter gelatinilyticus]